MNLIPAEIIKKTRDGITLSKEEINYLVDSFTQGSLESYQMSAWLMAVFFRGLNDEESTNLTQAMLHSGSVMNLSSLPGLKVDKHSTGGVGDKTSMILAPLVASAGIFVPMMAGRGLGHTGGTLDKLESIPGFSTDIDMPRFLKLMAKNNFAIIGQTKDLCPADKKIYALRDVTATVESLPLICASIMSKKLASNLDALVLDVKFGSGAFMKTVAQAETLAKALMNVGNRSGVKTAALLTSMEQPLGRFIGNSLEMDECLSILKCDSKSHLYEDTRHLSLDLAGHMLWLGGKAASAQMGYQLAVKQLHSGAAFEFFEKTVRDQGGDLTKLPKPQAQRNVVSKNSGYLTSMNCEQIGYAAISLGAGRLKQEDVVDPTAGIEMHVRLGDKVVAGQILFTMFAENEAAFVTSEARLLNSLQFSEAKVAPPALIAKYLLP